MQLKPARWNAAPALVAPEARRLWRGLAFMAPLWGGAGKGALLGPHGWPLAGADLAAGSTLQWRGTPFGTGAGISGASNLFSQDDFAPLVTATGAGSGDFTIVCLANPVAEARASAGVSQAVNGVVDGSMTALGFNTSGNATFAASSGTFAFMTRDSGGTVASVSGAIDGKYHLFGGRRNSGGITAWIDGVIRATSTGVARDILAAGADFSIGHIAGSASTGRIDTGCNLVLAAGWNRALSDAEMRLLARDLFCMFRPEMEWRGVWTALAGGGVLSPVDLSDAADFETPGITQEHILSAADAFFAESFETPVLALGGNLSPTDAFFAESFETPGILQAHLFAPQKMNFAAPFDFASLAQESPGAPGFRSHAISANARSAPQSHDERSKLITE